MFRRRSRSDYGRVLPTHRWQGLTRRQRLARWLAGWRPFLLIALLLLLWPTLDPALVEPPAFLATEPEATAGQFTHCEPHWPNQCVVDGDTIAIGERRIRIVGIDAPELHPPRCEAEAQQGEKATHALQDWLNQGPFEITGRIGDQRDPYGRELRILYRVLPDGTRSSAAEHLLASGTVRRYFGGLRGGWC